MNPFVRNDFLFFEKAIQELEILIQIMDDIENRYDLKSSMHEEIQNLLDEMNETIMNVPGVQNAIDEVVQAWIDGGF